MAKDRKARIIHSGKICVIRGDDFCPLTPDEQMTVDSIQRTMVKTEERKARKGLAVRLPKGAKVRAYRERDYRQLKEQGE